MDVDIRLIKIIRGLRDLSALIKQESFRKYCLSNSFKNKIHAMIKAAAPFHCPEKFRTFAPDFSKPVCVDTSFIRNFGSYRRAVKRLHREFDYKSLEKTYNLLADEYSKEMYLRIILYKLFDDIRFRFPTYYTKNFEDINTKFERLLVSRDDISLPHAFLQTYDLSDIGFDLKLLVSAHGIQVNFIDQQYKYRNIVSAEEGDYVIDGGACYGEITHYFASKVKESGKVFAFEFEKQNLDIFNRNIELNPKYQNNICLETKALSNVSNQNLYVFSDGAGTFVRDADFDGADIVKSVTIDDFVAQNNIQKIDFIKLDIEGCELDALKGAYKTITTFKPKLAICIYHKTEDVWEIPEYVHKIVPDYKLYIDHFTINHEESLLFAKV